MRNQSSSLRTHDGWKLHSSTAMSQWSKTTRDGGARSERVIQVRQIIGFGAIPSDKIIFSLTANLTR